MVTYLNLLKEFGYSQCNVATIPMVTRLKLMQDMGAFDANAQDHLKMVDKLKFLKQTCLNANIP
jgi:hypothetical protein